MVMRTMSPRGDGGWAAAIETARRTASAARLRFGMGGDCSASPHPALTPRPPLPPRHPPSLGEGENSRTFRLGSPLPGRGKGVAGEGLGVRAGRAAAPPKKNAGVAP